MRKTFYFICLLTIPILNFAQETYTIKTQIKPNKQYLISKTTKTHGEMTISGKEELMEKFEQNMQSPMLISNTSKTESVITTHEINNEDKIKAVIEYKEKFSESQLNGEVLIVQTPQFPEQIIGLYDSDGHYEIMSIKGGDFNDEVYTIMENMLNEMNQYCKFPDTPMAIGDTFSLQVPMSFPMETINQMDMTMDMLFTLNEIKDKHAYFGIDQKIDMGLSTDEFVMKAHGLGPATMIIDMTEDYPVNYESTLQLDLELIINNEMTINSTMNMDLNQKVEINSF